MKGKGFDQAGFARGLGVHRRANLHRGEVEAIIDGERRILCLTLGALAELETAFGVEDLGALAAYFAAGRLKAKDLVRVIGAGLRGGGNLFPDEEVAGMNIEGGVAGCARIATELLEAAFSDGMGVREKEAGTPRP